MMYIWIESTYRKCLLSDAAAVFRHVVCHYLVYCKSQEGICLLDGVSAAWLVFHKFRAHIVYCQIRWLLLQNQYRFIFYGYDPKLAAAFSVFPGNDQPDDDRRPFDVHIWPDRLIDFLILLSPFRYTVEGLYTECDFAPDQHLFL